MCPFGLGHLASLIYKHPTLGKIRLYVSGPKAGQFHHMRPSAVHEVGRHAGKMQDLPAYVRKLSLKGLPLKQAKPQPEVPKRKEPEDDEGGQMRLPGIPAAPPGSREEAMLSSGRVKSISDLHDDNINPVRIVILDNGMKAVFKPDPPRQSAAEFAEEGGGDTRELRDKGYDTNHLHRVNISDGLATEREVGAWEVAKLVGMTDMAAPAIIRTINGQRGAMLAYQEGTVAKTLWDGRYDGDKDLNRAAVFDYVIGNEDRHAGNWIVGANGKLRLIDHGLAFPDAGPHHQGWGNRAMEEKAAERQLGVWHTDLDPARVAAPYVKAKPAIAAALTSVGLPKESIDGVMERIDKISKTHDWRREKELLYGDALKWRPPGSLGLDTDDDDM